MSHMSRQDFVGGNAWVPQILNLMYPTVDQPWVSGPNCDGIVYAGGPSRDALWDLVTARAYGMMKDSALVDLSATETVPGTIDAQLKITNHSGHKLPTRYPEGRKMWIRIEAIDANGAAFYQAEHGLDYPSLGLSGPSFHFFMNNVPYKDNRILPKGAVQIQGLGGTDSYDPNTHPYPSGGLYPDGQNWDATHFSIAVPPGTPRPIKLVSTVYYQSVSREFIEFLANGGDSNVSTLPHPDALALLSFWDNGSPAPAVPVGRVSPASTQDPSSATPDQTAVVLIP